VLGTHILAATTKTSGASSLTPLLIILILFGVFYLVIFRPQRNRQRQAQQTQRQVMPGQRVRTTAGIYGTVVSGDDRDVVVEIAPGVNITMLRRAIMEVVPEDDQGGAPAAGETTTSTPAPAASTTGDEVKADDRGDLNV
jgi:preprotein translocase subunit YajC